MAAPLRILMLEDNPADAALVLTALSRAGFDLVVTQEDNEEDFREQLRPAPQIIIIADFCLPMLRALDIAMQQLLTALKHLGRSGCPQPVGADSTIVSTYLENSLCTA